MCLAILLAFLSVESSWLRLGYIWSSVVFGYHIVTYFGSLELFQALSYPIATFASSYWYLVAIGQGVGYSCADTKTSKRALATKHDNAGNFG